MLSISVSHAASCCAWSSLSPCTRAVLQRLNLHLCVLLLLLLQASLAHEGIQQGKQGAVKLHAQRCHSSQNWREVSSCCPESKAVVIVIDTWS